MTPSNINSNEGTTEASTGSTVNLESEPIWDLPGFVREEFYAAAYFLSRCQQQQNNTDRPPESRTPGNTRLLLDSLALLFARAWGRGADTPANVTATALETIEAHDPRSELKKRTLIIHVAKNAGCQDLEGMNDQKFANELATWIQHVDEEEPRAESGLWPHLVQFWAQRVQKYLRTLPTSEKLNEMESELKEYYEGAYSGWATFESDFAILRCYVAVKERHSSNEKKNRYTSACVYDMCFRLGDASEHRYHKYSRPASGQPETRPQWQIQAERFRRAIKHIKLLKTLRDVWYGMVGLRKGNSDASFKIQLLDPQPPRWLHLNEDEIIDTMESWKAPPDGNQEFVSDIAEVADYFTGRNAKRRLNFHCELQILELCISGSNSSKFEDYIGCSKLSCHLCWAVLRNADYQTKGTHSVLHPDCAFPFKVSSAPGHNCLAESFKAEQDKLLERIRQYSMQPNDSLSIYTSRSETNPYAPSFDDLSGSMSGASTAVSREVYPLELSFDVLKLSLDGSSTIERMQFYQLRRSPIKFGGRWCLPNFREPLYCKSADCHHPNGRIDSRWVTDFQLQQHRMNDRQWKWRALKLTLDREHDVYAEIQLLSLFSANYEDRPPGNSFNVQEYKEGDDLRFPFRGDVYLLGRIIEDDGRYVVPPATHSVCEEHAAVFGNVYRRFVKWWTRQDRAAKWTHATQICLDNRRDLYKLDLED